MAGFIERKLRQSRTDSFVADFSRSTPLPPSADPAGLPYRLPAAVHPALALLSRLRHFDGSGLRTSTAEGNVVVEVIDVPFLEVRVSQGGATVALGAVGTSGFVWDWVLQLRVGTTAGFLEMVSFRTRDGSLLNREAAIQVGQLLAQEASGVPQAIPGPLRPADWLSRTVIQSKRSHYCTQHVPGAANDSRRWERGLVASEAACVRRALDNVGIPHVDENARRTYRLGLGLDSAVSLTVTDVQLIFEVGEVQGPLSSHRARRAAMWAVNLIGVDARRSGCPALVDYCLTLASELRGDANRLGPMVFDCDIGEGDFAKTQSDMPIGVVLVSSLTTRDPFVRAIASTAIKQRSFTKGLRRETRQTSRELAGETAVLWAPGGSYFSVDIDRVSYGTPRLDTVPENCHWLVTDSASVLPDGRHVTALIPSRLRFFDNTVEEGAELLRFFAAVQQNTLAADPEASVFTIVG